VSAAALPGLFTRVRAAAAEVARRARQVRLEPTRLRTLARELAGEATLPGVYDLEHHHRGSPASTLAFVITLDAVNFGSGWFPRLRKRGRLSGYLTLASSLKRRFDAAGPWSAAELRALRAAEVAGLLGQTLEDPEVAELMELYARAWNELGAFLEQRHAGRFEGPLEEAAGSAERLVGILATMPFYRDVARYQELEVPFYKRAQITAADLHLAFEGQGPGRFADLAELTLFADNLVPHVLRMEGALHYAPELAARIEAGELLPAGAPEEVEIRAVALHAVELLVAEIRGQGGETSAQRIDQLLWSRGQGPSFKARPRHRTRTVFY
jgi:hypothetical protein